MLALLSALVEDRYFVLTADAFSYWEQEDDCEQGVQPRGFMSLPDITRFEARAPVAHAQKTQRRNQP